VALVLVAQPAVSVADSAPARQKLRQAIDLFGKGELGGARQALKQARQGAGAAADLLAEIHLHLGMIDVAEDRPQAAKAQFEQALAFRPGLRLDPYRHNAKIVQLFERVRRSLEGTLKATAEQPRTAVLLDGTRVGTAPYQARLVRGRYRVELRSTLSGQHLRRTVEIRPGQTAHVHARWPPAGTRDPGARQGGRRLWTWISAGGAVAAAATAAGLMIAADADRRAACDLLTLPDRCGEQSVLRDPSDRDRFYDLQASHDDKQLGATIAWITAGVLVATGAVLFWLEGRSSRADTRAAFGLDRGSKPLVSFSF
jgi:hypothetical protein